MNCPTCKQQVKKWNKPKEHKRPPRVFAQCPHCKDIFQAVPNINGLIDHVFKTGKLSSGRKQRNHRLTDAENEAVKKFLAEYRKP